MCLATTDSAAVWSLSSAAFVIAVSCCRGTATGYLLRGKRIEQAALSLAARASASSTPLPALRFPGHRVPLAQPIDPAIARPLPPLPNALQDLLRALRECRVAAGLGRYAGDLDGADRPFVEARAIGPQHVAGVALLRCRNGRAVEPSQRGRDDAKDSPIAQNQGLALPFSNSP